MVDVAPSRTSAAGSKEREVIASDRWRIGVEDANIVNDDDDDDDADDENDENAFVDHDGVRPDRLFAGSDPAEGRVENADTSKLLRRITIVWEGTMAKIIMDAAKVIMVDASTAQCRQNPGLSPTVCR